MNKTISDRLEIRNDLYYNIRPQYNTVVSDVCTSNTSGITMLR